MNKELKVKLVQTVSLLTPVAMKFENVSQPETEYAISSDYE
jgi:hypothetical protein